MPAATLSNPPIDLDAANALLADAEATAVIAWAYEKFHDKLMMTSSFGAQAAVMLHMVTRIVPRIPVVFIDTGYHFPETYRFVDALRDRLNLNLKVFQPTMSAAMFEALNGRLWEGGANEQEQLNRLSEYDRFRKVEPMQRAVEELAPQAWLAGLRKQQTDHRQSLRRVEMQDGVYKVHPILNWSGKEIHAYMKLHDLPYHPLVEKGYLSIGDWHSTLPVTAGEDERAGRFRGLKQECGIHLPTTREENESREGSML